MNPIGPNKTCYSRPRILPSSHTPSLWTLSPSPAPTPWGISPPSAYSPWNYPSSALSSEPPLPTGLAGFDAVAGGLRGITVVAGPSFHPCATTGLSLALGILERNPRLGAVICAATMPVHAYTATMDGLRSLAGRWKIEEGNLGPAEKGCSGQARKAFMDGVGRRISFLEPSKYWRDDYIGVPFDPAHILLEREQLFNSGEIDRCMVVIDGLHRVAVPIYADPDAAADHDQDPRVATDFQLGRRRFAFAWDVWRGMPWWCGRPQDPVLAVTAIAGVVVAVIVLLIHPDRDAPAYNKPA
jgi:hypothetical protein